MRVAICALLTAFVLIPGAILGIAAGGLVSETLPGNPTDPIRLGLTVLSGFIGMFVGGAVWGWSISRFTRAGAGRRMAVAGGIGFALTTIVVFLALGFLEDLVVEQQRGPQLPIHNVFTLLFVPAAAIVAGASGAALGFGMRDPAMAGRLLWMCAISGGSAFLVVNLTLDGLGFRVGAPGAAARATMMTTALLGNLAAAMAGGAVIGYSARGWSRAFAASGSRHSDHRRAQRVRRPGGR
ncbi:MAG: hypothetical protein E6I60_16630 [Chloroflexi bacterium]|nr:MAG: hypothetical protein E6I60_16630 [Chloroflexota bacterium]